MVSENRKLDLYSICTHKVVKEDSDFVGIRYDSEKKQFYIDFPLGYKNKDLPENNENLTTEDEKLLRTDILNLINILHKYGSNNQTQKAKEYSKKENNILPIFAYFYVIRDFLKNGYYKPKEIIYKKNASGKKNWNKTIKKIQPIVSNGNVVYLDFITRNNAIKENEILTKIHKYCVYEAFENIGCLLTSYLPPNPHIKLNKKQFTIALKEKIAKTFNDKEKLLFQNMLDIINFDSKEHNGNSFFYGTYEFHYVWEKLVDDYFGIIKTDEMYPVAKWVNTKQSKIEFIPDTIMIPENENKIFVLDAKYYKGGVNESLGSLPRAESIPKQLVYARKIDKVFNFEKKLNYPIYNAFIMPSDCFATNNKIIEYVAPVEVDWLFNDEEKKTYNHIQGIRLDIRTIMHNKANNREELFTELEKIIENGTEKIMKTKNL